MIDDTATINQVYDFVRAYIQTRGYSPSLREIAAGCHMGRSTVTRYLDRLEVQGRIVREIGTARSIRLK